MMSSFYLFLPVSLPTHYHTTAESQVIILHPAHRCSLSLLSLFCFVLSCVCYFGSVALGALKETFNYHELHPETVVVFSLTERGRGHYSVQQDQTYAGVHPQSSVQWLQSLLWAFWGESTSQSDSVWFFWFRSSWNRKTSSWRNLQPKVLQL